MNITKFKMVIYIMSIFSKISSILNSSNSSNSSNSDKIIDNKDVLIKEKITYGGKNKILNNISKRTTYEYDERRNKISEIITIYNHDSFVPPNYDYDESPMENEYNVSVKRDLHYMNRVNTNKIKFEYDDNSKIIKRIKRSMFGNNDIIYYKNEYDDDRNIIKIKVYKDLHDSNKGYDTKLTKKTRIREIIFKYEKINNKVVCVYKKNSSMSGLFDEIDQEVSSIYEEFMEYNTDGERVKKIIKDGTFPGDPERTVYDFSTFKKKGETIKKTTVKLFQLEQNEEGINKDNGKFDITEFETSKNEQISTFNNEKMYRTKYLRRPDELVSVEELYSYSPEDIYFSSEKEGGGLFEYTKYKYIEIVIVNPSTPQP